MPPLRISATFLPASRSFSRSAAASGEAPVVVDIVTSEGPRVFQLGTEYRVQPVPDFFAEAKALLGEAAVV